jgi:16S rRNA (guanine527-N7)-methyltransferase
MSGPDSQALRGVSRETSQVFSAYIEALKHWQKTHNLVAASTLPHLWSRHVADSYRLWPEVEKAWQQGTLVDLGSGAGFPGVVLAILAKASAHPERGSVLLIESNGKKAAFLRHVVRTLQLDAKILHDRIERVVSTLPVSGVDAVTARALAPLSDLLELSEPLLKAGAIGFFPKGARFEVEVTEASRYWNFNLALAQDTGQGVSRSDSAADHAQEGPILILRDVSRRAGLSISEA